MTPTSMPANDPTGPLGTHSSDTNIRTASQRTFSMKTVVIDSSTMQVVAAPPSSPPVDSVSPSQIEQTVFSDASPETSSPTARKSEPAVQQSEGLLDASTNPPDPKSSDLSVQTMHQPVPQHSSTSSTLITGAILTLGGTGTLAPKPQAPTDPITIGTLTLHAGGPGVTISGESVSADSTALVVGTQTIPYMTYQGVSMPSDPAPTEPITATLTIPSQTLTAAEQDSKVLSVGGTGLSPGGPGLTVGGEGISAVSGGIVVGSETVPLSPSDPDAISTRTPASPSAEILTVDGITVTRHTSLAEPQTSDETSAGAGGTTGSGTGSTAAPATVGTATGTGSDSSVSTARDAGAASNVPSSGAEGGQTRMSGGARVCGWEVFRYLVMALATASAFFL